MKISVPVMIQDPSLKGPTKVDKEYVNDATFSCFLDGPVTDRVAVVDFHPRTGKLVPGARVDLPTGRRKTGRYIVKDETKFDAADFCQCTTFGTVAAAIKMFEEKDVLGRKVRWAFDSPQILVVPRAGEWANAFYQRESASLQFYFFQSALDPKKTVYTCLSRDIVAHETGHAVLDGVCPWLYNAISPQSLALHEGIADLTALLVSFRNRKLSQMVLKETGGSIKDSSVFSAVAEEFGTERSPEGIGYLRDLNNDEVLDASVAYADPHVLCNVLTGAIYKVAMKLYEKIKKEEVGNSGKKVPPDAYNKALYLTHERLSRMLFRAIDYLPPGEVSFADYGRAIFAADQASHARYSPERNWLKKEFVRRGIVASEKDLNVKTNYIAKGLDFDLDELVESDWAAYTFAQKKRRFLGIPNDAPFEVHPRLDVTKKYYVGKGKTKEVRECLFKVSWQHTERNPGGWSLPDHRRFTIGTTLAIDWEETQKLKKAGRKEMLVRAKLTITPTAITSRQRDAFLEKLLGDGFLALDDRSQSLDGKKSRMMASADVAKGHLRIRGTARALHLIGDKS